MTYRTMSTGNVPIKMWTEGVPVESGAIDQLRNVASLPIVHSHIAVMPDVHFGIGATVGSVIPTRGAIIPAAVGVDIGCGMVAAMTNFSAIKLPDNLRELRAAVERFVPVGKASHDVISQANATRWRALQETHDNIIAKHPGAATRDHPGLQIGTLGGGNHFIEVCLNEDDHVWVMLHSGSRGIGNRIGTYFIAKAREEMVRQDVHLPDRHLAYLSEGISNYPLKGSACRKITDFERAWREAFASIPSERQVLDLICRTVADVERARLEWLASFVPKTAANVALSRA
jgi:tRNA-splicing ligase RtcB